MSFNKRLSEEQRRADLAAKTAVTKSVRPALLNALTTQYRLQGLSQLITQKAEKDKIERCDSLIAGVPSLQEMRVLQQAREKAWELIQCDQRIEQSPALQARLASGGLNSAREAAWQERICDKAIESTVDLQQIATETGLDSAREVAWERLCQEKANSILTADKEEALESHEAMAIAEQTLIANGDPVNLEEQDLNITSDRLLNMLSEAKASGEEQLKRARVLKSMSLGGKLTKEKDPLDTERSLRARNFEAQALTHYLTEATGMPSINSGEVKQILETSDQAAFKTVARLLYQSDNFEINDFYELSKASITDEGFINALVDFRHIIQDLNQLLTLTNATIDSPSTSTEMPALEALRLELGRKVLYTDLVMKAMDATMHHNGSGGAIRAAEAILESTMLFKVDPPKGHGIDKLLMKEAAMSYSFTAASNIYYEGQSDFIKAALKAYVNMNPSEQVRVLLDQKRKTVPESIEDIVSQASLAVEETHQRVTEKTIKMRHTARLEYERQDEKHEREKAYEKIIEQDSELKELKNQKKTTQLKIATWSRHLSNELNEKRDEAQFEKGLTPTKAWFKTVPKELISSARSSPEVRRLRATSREQILKSTTGKREQQAFSKLLSQATKTDPNIVRHFERMMAGYNSLDDARGELRGLYGTVGEIVGAYKGLVSLIKKSPIQLENLDLEIQESSINPAIKTFSGKILEYCKVGKVDGVIYLHQKARQDNIFNTESYSKSDAELLSKYDAALKKVFGKLEPAFRALEKAQQTLSHIADKSIQIEKIGVQEKAELDRDNPCGVLLKEALDSDKKAMTNHHHIR